MPVLFAYFLIVSRAAEKRSKGLSTLREPGLINRPAKMTHHAEYTTGPNRTWLNLAFQHIGSTERDLEASLRQGYHM